ncbi:MAG: methyltransferase domain-containing protein [Deltaproteobacteria bacterium]|nr:MAG: methyltransferase domain-containing protein [Deltaproteobacteria bacterium]
MDPGEYDRVFRLESRHFWYRGLHALLLRSLERYAPTGVVLRILDAGCGTGGLMGRLGRRGAVTGLDLSPRALSYAAARGERQLVRGSVGQLPFREASFDLVVSADVLYHRAVVDDEGALAELRRVCRPGGFVFLNLPAHAWLAGDHDRAIHTARRYAARRHRSEGDGMQGSYLGPGFADAEIARVLASAGAVAERLVEGELLERAARLLAEEKVVGWFQGRMEFGPRALGNRSILGDPRSPRMQSVMNLKIKFRESFRPFAPSVLREQVAEWFELDVDSPYMLLVAPVRERWRIAMREDEQRLFGIEKLNVPRSTIPAVTHVDYSARIQTVHAETNPLYHALLSRFHALTGCPVLVNTSFNVRGEPIVCTPADAYRCFMRTEMDHLAVGSFLLDKSRQPALTDDADWRREFALD